MDAISDRDLVRFWKELDRAAFMSENSRYADIDAAFPIGFGQTISQPSLVLQMTSMLQMYEGCRVLEVGTGSGYQTALLAKFAGKVFTVERIPELLDSARDRLEDMGFNNIEYKLGDGSKGWQENAPYDRIMVTAGARSMPEKLTDQLAKGGRMVIPVGAGVQRLTIVEKDEKGEVYAEEDIPVTFVKLIGDY